MKDDSTVAMFAFGTLVVVVIAGLLVGGPIYGVWQQGLNGKAELQKAEPASKRAATKAIAPFTCPLKAACLLPRWT